MTRHVPAALVAACLLFSWTAVPAQDVKKPSPLPKEITWKLQVLDELPFKVVTTTYDAKAQTVFWVIELVRDLDVFEDGAHWAPAYKEGRKTRFRFELVDIDGIVLKTVEGRYVGEYVTRAGKRFGAVLELPFELVKYTKTIEAVAK
jgi:hypothetical protein